MAGTQRQHAALTRRESTHGSPERSAQPSRRVLLLWPRMIVTAPTRPRRDMGYTERSERWPTGTPFSTHNSALYQRDGPRFRGAKPAFPRPTLRPGCVPHVLARRAGGGRAGGEAVLNSSRDGISIASGAVERPNRGQASAGTIGGTLARVRVGDGDRPAAAWRRAAAPSLRPLLPVRTGTLARPRRKVF